MKNATISTAAKIRMDIEIKEAQEKYWHPEDRARLERAIETIKFNYLAAE